MTRPTDGSNALGLQDYQEDEKHDCNDGVDNDLDGAIDWDGGPNGNTLDSGCTGPIDFTELNDCNDGVDNDGDGFIDYPGDPDCVDINDPIELPEPAQALMLVSGVGLLEYLQRRRRSTS